jgi:hypothetical protein
MCACVRITACSDRGSKPGSAQLRSRSSFWPWNRPQSISTAWPASSSRKREPVTVPAPPWKVSRAIERGF